MKNLFIKSGVVAASLFVLGLSTAQAGSNAVTITEPANGATVTSPVKVCLGAHGVTVEPAKKGVNDGKGHNHILVDVDLPKDLSKGIGKDAQHIHMGDGSTCKEIKLAPGTHVIRTLFAKGLALHVTNPKAVLFFGALYSIGIPVGATLGQLAIVVGAIGLQSLIVFHGYAVIFSTPAMTRTYLRTRRWFEAAFALGFGAAGLKILTARLQP